MMVIATNAIHHPGRWDRKRGRRRCRQYLPTAKAFRLFLYTLER